MTDQRIGVLVTAGGNFVREFQRYGQAVAAFSRNGQRHLQLFASAGATIGRGLDALGNRYTALLTGAAGAGAARYVIQLEQRFARLGIVANRTEADIDGLKKRIFEVSQLPNIRIDPGELTSAVEDILEKTGDLDFATDNLENLALAIQATGAEGGAIGAIAAEFQKMGIVSRRDVREALDILNVQGKEGAFTLQNLARLGPRVVTAYTAMGRTGVPAIREMGAALQVIRQGTGSAEMAATAFEAVMRTLSDADKVKKLRKGGIQLFDADELKKGREILRPINELMVEIVRKSAGKKTVLSEVFDAEAIRAFNAAASEFLRTGSMESLDRFMSVQADGSSLLRDSARAAATAESALVNLRTAWQSFADGNLAGPIQSLADVLKSIDPGRLQSLFSTGAKLAAALGVAVIGRKVMGLGGSLAGAAAGGGAGPTAGAGGLAGVPAGVQPVFVTNFPGVGMTGMPDGPGTAGGGGRLAKLGRAAQVAGQGVAALSVGYAVGTVGNELLSSGLSAARGQESTLGTALYDWLNGEEESRALRNGGPVAKVGGTVKIQIDGDARARVTEARSENPGVDLQVDTGRVMQAH